MVLENHGTGSLTSAQLVVLLGLPGSGEQKEEQTGLTASLERLE